MLRDNPGNWKPGRDRQTFPVNLTFALTITNCCELGICDVMLAVDRKHWWRYDLYAYT